METFKLVLFVLAVLASLACTLLLYRGYRNTRLRILLWSALCFVCLTINNLLVFVDLIVLPETVDLRVLRHATALTGMAFLLYGFIRDSE
jgi:Family of unknown function (DUF5985)